jgi:hypothetical protein
LANSEIISDLLLDLCIDESSNFSIFSIVYLEESLRTPIISHKITLNEPLLDFELE